MAIHFFTEDISFKLADKKITKDWLNYVISNEGKKTGELNFIFTSDKNILQINRQYLNHDYFTDIITFNYNQDTVISGDIFISIDTVRNNAGEFSESFKSELHRVVVHGVLHLTGYDDENDTLRATMRSREDFYLSHLRSKFLLK